MSQSDQDFDDPLDPLEPEPLEPEPSPEPTPAQPATVARRSLMGGLALGGVAVGAGAIGAFASRAGASTGYRKQSLTVEVACLGSYMRNIEPDNRQGPNDFRNAFCVEGWIYPAGTIKGDGFVPVEEGSIGRWFCYGWFINNAEREEPHLTSTQNYIFGSITKERLFPPSTLTSAGLEGGGGKEEQAFIRSVTGGTGEYLGATGQVLQWFIGDNTALFDDGDTSPNFRFEFDLRILD